MNKNESNPFFFFFHIVFNIKKQKAEKQQHLLNHTKEKINIDC